MRHRKGYMFTNKKQSQRGIISSILGTIALASIIIAVVLSYKSGGEKSARLGLSVIFSCIFAIVGLIQGTCSKMEKDVFLFFPIYGIATNVIVILGTMFILYAGVYGL